MRSALSFGNARDDISRRSAASAPRTRRRPRVAGGAREGARRRERPRAPFRPAAARARTPGARREKSPPGRRSPLFRASRCCTREQAARCDSGRSSVQDRSLRRREDRDVVRRQAPARVGVTPERSGCRCTAHPRARHRAARSAPARTSLTIGCARCEKFEPRYRLAQTAEASERGGQLRRRSPPSARARPPCHPAPRTDRPRVRPAGTRHTASRASLPDLA